MAGCVVHNDHHRGVAVQSAFHIPLTVPLLEVLDEPHERDTRLGLLGGVVEHNAGVEFIHVVPDDAPPTLALEDDLQQHKCSIPAGDGSGFGFQKKKKSFTKLFEKYFYRQCKATVFRKPFSPKMLQSYKANCATRSASDKRFQDTFDASGTFSNNRVKVQTCVGVAVRLLFSEEPWMTILRSPTEAYVLTFGA